VYIQYIYLEIFVKRNSSSLKVSACDSEFHERQDEEGGEEYEGLRYGENILVNPVF